jgi:hypothetical protein
MDRDFNSFLIFPNKKAVRFYRTAFIVIFDLPSKNHFANNLLYLMFKN